MELLLQLEAVVETVVAVVAEQEVVVEVDQVEATQVDCSTAVGNAEVGIEEGVGLVGQQAVRVGKHEQPEGALPHSSEAGELVEQQGEGRVVEHGQPEPARPHS